MCVHILTFERGKCIERRKREIFQNELENVDQSDRMTTEFMKSFQC